MYKDLNSMIPPNKALLSFDPFLIDQFPGVKAASYRPEVAWYLDREITEAKKMPDIVKEAETGKYPYYLMPQPCEAFNSQTNAYFSQLSAELAKRYKIVKQYSYISWQSRKVPWTKFVPWVYELNPNEQQFYRRGMFPQAIFDINSPPAPK